jgi:ArsR family transcriptional regulator
MIEDELTLNKFFKLLGDWSKFKIISSLKNGEKCVCVIYKELGLDQTLVSHHLSALKRAGLIKGRKSGKWVYYSINREHFAEIENLFNKLLGHENFKNENNAESVCVKDICD